MQTVLVVDDEPDIRELIQINLEAAGYLVITAANGSEALQLVRDEVPDAMFLDVMMPGVDGFSVLEELKAGADYDLSHIPVVMVSAVTETEHRIRGGIEGALHYITKPFDPADLVRVLEKVLDPTGPPEQELRRQVQRDSLEALARYERTGDEDVVDSGEEPRVRLTRLEHVPSSPAPPPRLRQARDKLSELTPKQQQLLEALADGAPVTNVATDLGMSRSNIYASLRRIGRKLGLQGTNELLALVRQGALLDRRPEPRA